MADSDIPDYAEMLTLRRRRRRQFELWHQLDITMKKQGQKFYPVGPLLGLPGIGLSPVATMKKRGRSGGWDIWGEATHAVSGQRVGLGNHQTREEAIDAALDWYTAQAQRLAHQLHQAGGGKASLDDAQETVYNEGAAAARDLIRSLTTP